MSDDLRLPENVEFLIQKSHLAGHAFFDAGHDVRCFGACLNELRRAIKAALLRAEADGLEKGAVDSSAEYQRERWNVLRAQADALEAGK